MANIMDVAKLAGVSKATVSNVFNNKINVSEEMRARVLKAAEELSYLPNKLAAGLSTKRTNIVGLFLEDVKKFRTLEYHLIDGVVNELHKYGYRVLIYKTTDTKLFHNEIIAGSEPIDGAIILAPLTEDMRVDDLLDSGVPLILIGNPPQGKNVIPHIDVNNEEITYTVVKYLLDIGHKNIAFINSKSNMTITFDRLKGYVKAILEYDLEFNPNFVYNCDNTRYTGEKLAERILSLEKVTAIVTESDEVACGVYEGIKNKGLNIPQDISVFALGGDDAILEPKVSTVFIDYKELGKIAAQNIINLINNKLEKNWVELNSYEIIKTDSIKESSAMIY